MTNLYEVVLFSVVGLESYELACNGPSTDAVFLAGEQFGSIGQR